jgi:hypothetical protein
MPDVVWTISLSLPNHTYLMRTIFLELTSDALRVRWFYGCVANYAKKINSFARKLLLMEGWVASLTMRPNNLQKI